MAAVAQRGARAERTRARILAAAEDLFAERGFSDTRLEDVAERIGVRRAALFYHFDDKQDLYEAVLRDVFETALTRIRTALGSARSLAPALEAGIGSWVDYVGERPSAAHLLLREAASRTSRTEFVAALVGPAVELMRQIFDRGEREGVFRPVTRDPYHFASTIFGSTIFFVAGLPGLVRDLPFDPLAPDQLERHRSDVLRSTRRLLGLRAPRPTRSKG